MSVLRGNSSRSSVHLTYVAESLGERKNLHAAMVKDGDVRFQILPLQSTREHMDMIRTLAIGRNKRLAIWMFTSIEFARPHEKNSNNNNTMRSGNVMTTMT